MTKKNIFLLLVTLVFLTLNSYLFFTAPEPLKKMYRKESYTYSVNDGFQIVANLNDKYRTCYTKLIVGDGTRAGMKFDENWQNNEIEAGPLPALFLRSTSAYLEKSPVPLRLYLGSDFPISGSNLLKGIQAEKFKEITHRDEMQKVITGIEASLEAGLLPVKINVVAMRGINDDEILDFAKFGRDRSVIVRFIEFMPLDADEKWSTSAVLSQEEIFSTINSVYPLEAVERSNAPASRFRYLDGQGEIGIVASVTQKFCGSCDRIRITADGQFRNCLFSNEEFDLKEALRSGSSDSEICEFLESAVLAKREGHGIGNVDFIRPARSMSQIGG